MLLWRRTWTNELDFGVVGIEATDDYCTRDGKQVRAIRVLAHICLERISLLHDTYMQALYQRR